jgi:hypothetical protein
MNPVRLKPNKSTLTLVELLQTDGYAAHESLAKQRGDLALVGCWAHSRRAFTKHWPRGNW